MKWHNESWVKLYIRRTAEWDDLSVMARGMGNELLKYAKNDGSLCRTKGREPAMAVALVLKPKPEELEAVVAAAGELIEDGYLVVSDGFIWIKNYEDAQERRSPSAVKQQRYRDRKEAETHESTGNAVTTDALLALPGSEMIRDETRRDELFKLTSPPAPESPVVPLFDFASVYAAYPRKEGRTKGIARLRSQVRTPEAFEQLKQAVTHFTEKHAAEGTEKQFIPHFSTWCSGGWRDFIDGPHVDAEVLAKQKVREYRNYQAPRAAVTEGKDVKL